MYVLLLSITERTREIGIRKAIGALRREVVVQFLTESVTISLVGSLVGLCVGLAGLAIALPLIRQITGAPFTWEFRGSLSGSWRRLPSRSESVSAPIRPGARRAFRR
jgi:putative ABC transport system permease protein